MTLTLDMMVPGAVFTNGKYTFTITKVEGDDLWYRFDHWEKQTPGVVPEEGYRWGKVSFLRSPGIVNGGYVPAIDEIDLWK